jgi:hypothetical protein
MYGSWGKYYAPLHINNTNGNPYIGDSLILIVENLFNSTTTHISVLADGNGNTYMPKATNFIDVYSGGSPFTLTQELVQRGAEVQDDDLRIVIGGKTREVVYDVLRYLRAALTNQSYGMPAVLSIKRPSDTKYTEWFVMSANIQEDPTTFGRDVKSLQPSLYLKMKLTRSPYGADKSVTYLTNLTQITNQSKFVVYDKSYSYFNLGDLVNLDFNFRLPDPTSTLGPVVFNFITDDTFFDVGGYPAVLFSGTLAAGASATLGTYNYAVQDIDSIGCPLSIIVVADVQVNEIEIRATVQGYSTPYVRSVGTQISATGTLRVFQLPPIDVASIFSGMPNYDNSFELPITLSIRNINRGSTRTYTVYEVTMFRVMNSVQMTPTVSGAMSGLLTPSVQYRVVSFYDNLYLPVQPLPAIKGIISSSINNYGALSNGELLELRYEYLQAMEVRGTAIRVQKNDSVLYGYVIFMGSNCQIITDLAVQPFLYARFRFAHLYQSAGS